MVNKQNISGWTPEQWEADRQKRVTIGGSDAGAILGLNEYKSAYTLWAEKTGRVTPPDLSSNESVREGKDLEQYVADRWAERTGKRLRKDNNILTNTAYPFAHANIDRRVIGDPKAGFEAKTTSNWKYAADMKAGKMPDVWLAQCVHYMMVTGAKRWYLGALAFGVDLFTFTVERDEDDIKALAGAESDFWRMVQDNTPPDVDGAKGTEMTLKTIYADSAEGTSADLEPVRTKIEMAQALKAQIEELETQKAKLEQEIQIFMGDAEKGSCAGFAISWKTQAGRKTFDSKAFEKDHGPILPKYYKVGNATRPFKIKEVK